MNIRNFLISILTILITSSCNNGVYKLSDYGVSPNTGEDMTQKIAEVIEIIKNYGWHGSTKTVNDAF